MIPKTLQIEGTWEQVALLGNSLAGQRVRVTVLTAAPGPETKNTVPIAQAFAEMVADIPEEERAKLPTDLAEQHDHYIYGWPRK